MKAKQTFFKPFNVKYIVLTLMYLLGSYGWLAAFAPQPVAAQTNSFNCNVSRREVSNDGSVAPNTIQYTVRITDNKINSPSGPQVVAYNDRNDLTKTVATITNVANNKSSGSVSFSGARIPYETGTLGLDWGTHTEDCGQFNNTRKPAPAPAPTPAPTPIADPNSGRVASCTSSYNSSGKARVVLRTKADGKLKHNVNIYLDGKKIGSIARQTSVSSSSNFIIKTFPNTPSNLTPGDHKVTFQENVTGNSRNNLQKPCGTIDVPDRPTTPTPSPTPSPTPPPQPPAQFIGGNGAGTYFCAISNVNVVPKNVKIGDRVRFTMTILDNSSRVEVVSSGSYLETSLGNPNAFDASDENIGANSTNSTFPATITKTVDYKKAGRFEAKMYMKFKVNGVNKVETCANPVGITVTANTPAPTPAPTPSPTPAPTPPQNSRLNACTLTLLNLPTTSTTTRAGDQIEFRLTANNGKILSSDRYSIVRTNVSGGSGIVLPTDGTGEVATDTTQIVNSFTITGGNGDFTVQAYIQEGSAGGSTGDGGNLIKCGSSNRLNGDAPSNNPVEEETANAKTVAEFKEAYSKTACVHRTIGTAQHVQCIENLQSSVDSTCASVTTSTEELGNCTAALTMLYDELLAESKAIEANDAPAPEPSPTPTPTPDPENKGGDNTAGVCSGQENLSDNAVLIQVNIPSTTDYKVSVRYSMGNPDEIGGAIPAGSNVVTLHAGTEGSSNGCSISFQGSPDESTWKWSMANGTVLIAEGLHTFKLVGAAFAGVQIDSIVFDTVDCTLTDSSNYCGGEGKDGQARLAEQVSRSDGEASQSNGQLSLIAGKRTGIENGETVSVDVNLTGSDLKKVNTVITYDPEKLEYTSFDGGSTLTEKVASKTTDGLIEITLGAEGAIANTLGTLKFRALVGEGTTIIDAGSPSAETTSGEAVDIGATSASLGFGATAPPTQQPTQPIDDSECGIQNANVATGLDSDGNTCSGQDPVDNNDEVVIPIDDGTDEVLEVISQLYAPTSFVAQPGTTTVALSWKANDKNQGAVTYLLTRDGNKVAELSEANSSGNFTANDTGLTPGIRYSYRVYAVQGDKTSPANAMTVSTVNPGVSNIRDTPPVVVSEQSGTPCNTTTNVFNSSDQLVASTVETNAQTNHAIQTTPDEVIAGEQYRYEVIGSCLNGESQVLGTGDFAGAGKLPNTGPGDTLIVLAIAVTGIMSVGVILDIVRRNNGRGSTPPLAGVTPGGTTTSFMAL